MCKGVVAAQSSEIGFMTKWLKSNGYPEKPKKCKPMKSAMKTVTESRRSAALIDPFMSAGIGLGLALGFVSLVRKAFGGTPSEAPWLATTSMS